MTNCQLQLTGSSTCGNLLTLSQTHRFMGCSSHKFTQDFTTCCCDDPWRILSHSPPTSTAWETFGFWKFLFSVGSFCCVLHSIARCPVPPQLQHFPCLGKSFTCLFEHRPPRLHPPSVTKYSHSISLTFDAFFESRESLQPLWHHQEPRPQALSLTSATRQDQNSEFVFLSPTHEACLSDNGMQTVKKQRVLRSQLVNDGQKRRDLKWRIWYVHFHSQETIQVHWISSQTNCPEYSSRSNKQDTEPATESVLCQHVNQGQLQQILQGLAGATQFIDFFLQRSDDTLRRPNPNCVQESGCTTRLHTVPCGQWKPLTTYSLTRQIPFGLITIERSALWPIRLVFPIKLIGPLEPSAPCIPSPWNGVIAWLLKLCSSKLPSCEDLWRHSKFVPSPEYPNVTIPWWTRRSKQVCVTITFLFIRQRTEVIRMWTLEHLPAMMNTQRHNATRTFLSRTMKIENTAVPVIRHKESTENRDWAIEASVHKQEVRARKTRSNTGQSGTKSECTWTKLF